MYLTLKVSLISLKEKDKPRYCHVLTCHMLKCHQDLHCKESHISSLQRNRNFPTHSSNLVVQYDSNQEIKNDYGIRFYVEKGLEAGQGRRKSMVNYSFYEK